MSEPSKNRIWVEMQEVRGGLSKFFKGFVTVFAHKLTADDVIPFAFYLCLFVTVNFVSF